jgi:hypothetical protein
MSRLFPGIAEGVIDRVSQPVAETGSAAVNPQGRNQRRRRRCWALRLYFSVGVSW